jgi:predicted RNA-binding Zn-ribbon protein involved in translation (DUF1610 family)
MPASAINKEKKLVSAENLEFQIDEKRPLFSCPECSKRMVFVDGSSRYIKHFRHYRREECEYETEPETKEHYYAKRVVEAIFKHFSATDKTCFYGREHKIIDSDIGMLKYADVYCESNKSEQKIVVEVQQANYDIPHFLDKILFYIYRGYTVVYLFIGNQFGKTLRENSNIYILKEIENKIFHEKNLPVWGGYLSYDTNKIPYVEIPTYSQKYKRGASSFYYGDEYDYSSSYCTTRFIKNFNPDRMRLKDWLFKIMYEYDSKYSKSKLCNCKRTFFVKSEQKIVRYKEVCVYCKKTLRWLPNKEALSMGLKL